MLPTTLYERWMALNGGNYQVGNSRPAMDLWLEFTKYKRSDDPSVEVLNIPQPSALSYYTCRKHSLKTIKINWSRVKSRKDVLFSNEIWSYSSDADKNKTVLDVASILWHAKHHKLTHLVDAMLPYLSIHFRNITVASLLIHAVGNPSIGCLYTLWSQLSMCCLTESDFKNSAKALSTAIRRTQHWPDGKPAKLAHIAHCAYFELAIGRSRNTSDWEVEERKRTKEFAWLRIPHDNSEPTESTNAEFLLLMKEELDKIMLELIPSVEKRESWEEFCRRRQSWISSGSSGGARIEVAGQKIRINKHVYFENITLAEMTTWLNVEPRVEAVASEKYEMGKGRAIYGTKPLDYAIMSFCIMDPERKFYRIKGVESGLRGLDEVAGVLRRKLIASNPTTESTMIDYADFNYQHTLAAQALVFEALRDRYARLGVHEDLISAAEWCRLGLLNQWCTYPKATKAVKITQGMFSGCRGTNFLNTILNVTYYRTIRSYVNKELKLSPDCEYNIHQGDDVWLSNNSRLWAIAIYNAAEAAGFEFQASKQLFGIGIGEFLRVLYTAEGALGYMARAIGTFIMKPVQGSDIFGPAERASALNSQISILFRRGMTLSACNMLWDATVPYAASVQLASGGFHIPKGILRKSYLDGGLDIGPPMTMAIRTVATAPVPTLIPASAELEAAVPSHMTNDWIKCMSATIQEAFDAPSVAKSIHAANVKDSLRTEDRKMSLRVLERQLHTWKEKLISTEGFRSPTDFSLYIAGGNEHVYIQSTLQKFKGVMFRKTGFESRTPIDNLLTAIAQSPYRDISTAQRALGCSVLDAAKACVRLCPILPLTISANGLLVSLELYCSVPITARILQGVRQGGTTFECIWHPIIMSWLQKIALHLSIVDAMYYRINEINEWDNLLTHWNQVVVKAAYAHGVLESISHY